MNEFFITERQAHEQLQAIAAKSKDADKSGDRTLAYSYGIMFACLAAGFETLFNGGDFLDSLASDVAKCFGGIELSDNDMKELFEMLDQV